MIADLPMQSRPSPAAGSGAAGLGIRCRALRAAALLTLLGAGATAASFPSHASEREPPWSVLAQTSSPRVSLADAAERVQRATGGRILDARDEGSQHRIKVLTRQGEVRVVTVDARTGAMR